MIRVLILTQFRTLALFLQKEETMYLNAMQSLDIRPAFARMDSHQDRLEDVDMDMDCPAMTTTTIHTPNMNNDKGLHLLHLPREIRDQIYSHLYQPRQLRWEVNKRDLHCVAIDVPRAPIPAVLRTCTRLHEEYRESRLSRSISATISTTRATNHETAALTDMQCHAVEDSVILHGDAAPIEHVAHLLASIKDLTILVNNKRSMADDPSIWNELQSLEAILSPFYQTLSTVRIGVHQWQDPKPLQMNSRRETKAYQDPDLSRSSFMPAPSATFMGKPLVQQAAGYRLQLVLLQLHPSDPKDLLERFHRHRTGVYVFSNESPLRLARDDLYWGAEEALQSFPMKGSWFNMQRSMNLNLRDRFDAAGVTDAWIQTEYGPNARRMVEWRERRGLDADEWEN